MLRKTLRSAVLQVSSHEQPRWCAGSVYHGGFDTRAGNNPFSAVYRSARESGFKMRMRKRPGMSWMKRSYIQPAAMAGMLAAILFGGCTTRTAQTAPNFTVPVTVAKAVQKTVP